MSKILILGNTEGRRRGRQRMRWLDGITDSMDTNLSKFQETVKDRGAWQSTVHRVTRVRHDLMNKPPPKLISDESFSFFF